MSHTPDVIHSQECELAERAALLAGAPRPRARYLGYIAVAEHLESTAARVRRRADRADRMVDHQREVAIADRLYAEAQALKGVARQYADDLAVNGNPLPAEPLPEVRS
jgi:hypothetical protein